VCLSRVLMYKRVRRGAQCDYHGGMKPWLHWPRLLNACVSCFFRGVAARELHASVLIRGRNYVLSDVPVCLYHPLINSRPDVVLLRGKAYLELGSCEASVVEIFANFVSKKELF